MNSCYRHSQKRLNIIYQTTSLAWGNLSKKKPLTIFYFSYANYQYVFESLASLLIIDFTIKLLQNYIHVQAVPLKIDAKLICIIHNTYLKDLNLPYYAPLFAFSFSLFPGVNHFDLLQMSLATHEWNKDNNQMRINFIPWCMWFQLLWKFDIFLAS